MNGAPNEYSRETKAEKPGSKMPRPPAPAILVRDTPLQPLHCLKVSCVLQDGVGPVHGSLLGGGHGRRLCIGGLSLSAGKNQGQAHARKTDPLQPDLLLGVAPLACANERGMAAASVGGISLLQNGLDPCADARCASICG
jgi:hypothetical protein